MKTGLFAVALAICLLAGAMSGAALAGMQGSQDGATRPADRTWEA